MIDVLRPGRNFVAGEPGQTLTGGNSPTVLDASLGDQFVLAGNANDVVIGGALDVIIVGNGNDTIVGGANELIIAGNGNDVVFGGANDRILLGNGRDTITVGSSDDIRVGKGADTFIFNQVAATGIGKDTISGFSTALEHIQFNASLLASCAAVRAHAKQIRGDTVIIFDQNKTFGGKTKLAGTWLR
jgi:Ca2+-binding RTX toxin-like protein